MATINAYGVLFREWESLLDACRENEGALDGVDTFRVPLEDLLGRLKDLKGRQENLEGERQQTTQQIQELLEEGREAVRRLRVFVKVRLGTRSERLTQFGIAPLRRRGRRVKPAVPPPPPPVE